MYLNLKLTSKIEFYPSFVFVYFNLIYLFTPCPFPSGDYELSLHFKVSILKFDLSNIFFGLEIIVLSEVS